MDVAFARRARQLLEAGGLDVAYHESTSPTHRPGAHPAGRGLALEA
jgi:hypothetical protein